MKRMVLWVPLPGQGCSPNWHGHWSARDRDVRDHRRSVALAAAAWIRNNGWSNTGRIRIWAVWFMARKGARTAAGVTDGLYRPLDTQNAIGALKAAVDGLVDGGVILADDHTRVQFGDMILARNVKDHRGRVGLALIVEPVLFPFADRAKMIDAAISAAME